MLDGASVDVVVTSPPYNLNIAYGQYADSRPEAAYLDWMVAVAAALKRVMRPDGSFFLNIGGSSSQPWLPFELITRLRPLFVLQNHITWIKSIATGADSVGHFKPTRGARYLHHAHEHIFHLTATGTVKLDRLAIGVPYKDKSNIARRGHAQDLRCRGNTWFIPYDTVQSRAEKFHHPGRLPARAAALVHPPARRARCGGARPVHGHRHHAVGRTGGIRPRDRHRARSELRGRGPHPSGSGASVQLLIEPRPRYHCGMSDLTAASANPRVALFVTCLVDLHRPTVGFAAIRLLERAGCRVEVPRAQTCCGQPAYNSGDRATARDIARDILAAFSGYDYVVVPSGSCGGMIRHHLPGLFDDDPNTRLKAETLAAKTYELVGFLTDVMGVEAVDARLCRHRHLPRQLLRPARARAEGAAAPAAGLDPGREADGDGRARDLLRLRRHVLREVSRTSAPAWSPTRPPTSPPPGPTRCWPAISAACSTSPGG